MARAGGNPTAGQRRWVLESQPPGTRLVTVTLALWLLAVDPGRRRRLQGGPASKSDFWSLVGQSGQLRAGDRSGGQEVCQLAAMLANVCQVHVEEGPEGLTGMGVPAGAASPQLTLAEVRQDFTSSGPTIGDVAEQLSARVTDVWESRCAMIVDSLILGTVHKLGWR